MAEEAACSRVLDALTDADVLGLQPHPAPEAVRRAFRGLAKALHPDKNGSTRAAAAFQRLNKAFRALDGRA